MPSRQLIASSTLQPVLADVSKYGSLSNQPIFISNSNEPSTGAIFSRRALHEIKCDYYSGFRYFFLSGQSDQKSSTGLRSKESQQDSKNPYSYFHTRLRVFDIVYFSSYLKKLYKIKRVLPLRIFRHYEIGIFSSTFSLKNILLTVRNTLRL